MNIIIAPGTYETIPCPEHGWKCVLIVQKLACQYFKSHRRAVSHRVPLLGTKDKRDHG